MNVPAKQLTKQRLELILLFALPIVGILLMTGYYFYVIESQTEMGTHNKGVLVSPPKPLMELGITSSGKPFKLSDGSGNWTFLVVGSEQCSETCQQQLYLTRQTKEALGKYKLRIRNIYLMLDQAEKQQPTAALVTLLGDEYADHVLLHVDASAFQVWANQVEPALNTLPSVQFYIVDPAGWLMMYYGEEHNYKQVISDMKFLIKNS